MKALNKKTETLSRFFHKSKPVPCRVAGRYRQKNTKSFQLFSQGLSLNFSRTEKQAEEMEHLKEGDWIHVLIEDIKHQVCSFKHWTLIQTSRYKSQPCLSSFLIYAGDWENFLDFVRSFFKSRGLISIQTPSLLKAVGTEPHLTPFTTFMSLKGKQQKMFLPTSPELALKKLLCLGGTDIFEIKKCFREGELGPLHYPEFFLLEWYRAFFSLEELIEEVISLLDALKSLSFFKGPSNLSVRVFTFRELFKKYLDFSLTPNTGKEELIQLIKKRGIPFSEEDSFENLFHLLFLNFIEPLLPHNDPVVIKDYPPDLRAYSQLNKEGWAGRFELYWRGMELANAFYEVNETQEQEALFKKELQENPSSNRPMDTELLSLMQKGMPPCCGIALGLDRLFAAVYNKQNISFFRFPFS